MFSSLFGEGREVGETGMLLRSDGNFTVFHDEDAASVDIRAVSDDIEMSSACDPCHAGDPCSADVLLRILISADNLPCTVLLYGAQAFIKEGTYYEDPCYRL